MFTHNTGQKPTPRTTGQLQQRRLLCKKNWQKHSQDCHRSNVISNLSVQGITHTLSLSWIHVWNTMTCFRCCRADENKMKYHRAKEGKLAADGARHVAEKKMEQEKKAAHVNQKAVEELKQENKTLQAELVLS